MRTMAQVSYFLSNSYRIPIIRRWESLVYLHCAGETISTMERRVFIKNYYRFPNNWIFSRERDVNSCKLSLRIRDPGSCSWHWYPLETSAKVTKCASIWASWSAIRVPPRFCTYLTRLYRKIPPWVSKNN